MDKSEAAINAIKLINQAKEKIALRPLMIKEVCSYFDLMKDNELSQSDKLFMHYLANQAGIPQYYYPMLNIGTDVDEEVTMQTICNYVQESSMVVGDGVMLHRYQKEVLNMFIPKHRNRYFLSAATSFGKTFLIYEVVRKMRYSNIAFIFPTISLLSENIFKIYTKPEYAWIKNNFAIHTLSDTEILRERNIFIFTPERYLSFLDKNDGLTLDFVFVDEAYKLDNGFIIDETLQENERDIAYRIALYELLKNENTDALLVGPYIVFPNSKNLGDQSSFKTFLDKYGFVPIDYNNYNIVDKDEIIINTARHIKVNDTFSLNFTEKTKKAHVIQLVKQLLERSENTIIYCSQKHSTENWAKELINGDSGLQDIDDKRVVKLINHIGNLFTDRKGNQWIVSKALKKGIGIHHGLVPKYIQQEIISLFNEGILKILICTTTITEGVNTTAKNIIILSGKKGTKDLKKFDAQNIEGRAGRFMKHYKGRVFIMDNEFCKCVNGQDELLQHKFFDKNIEKQDVDIILTEPSYLTEKQIERRDQLIKMKNSGAMPNACFEEFRTISYEDKIYLYNTITRFSLTERNKIKELIKRFIGQHKPYSPGLELICQSIRPIIKNDQLRFYAENGDGVSGNCFLTGMISAFILRGFVGSANYYINKEHDVDKGIRKAANFVYNILRYQVVKYFSLFNLLYKHFEAANEGIDIDKINGIEALLLRLEYSADTKLGRQVSDIGASFKVIQYYDAKESNPNNQNMIRKLYDSLDDFEKNSIFKIEQIL